MWLCFFRVVPARRPNTRISEGENEQIVKAHPNVSYCQWKDVRRGHISFRTEIRIMSLSGGIVITADFEGTVLNLGDLITDEYSFVIKCPAFRHLPVRRKNSSALQGRWLEEPEGFPTHVSFRMANKTAIMAAARETKRYDLARKTKRPLWPRGCETPSAPSGLVPLRGGTVHFWRL